MPVSDHCIDYAMDWSARPAGPAHGGPTYIGEWVSWGPGRGPAGVDPGGQGARRARRPDSVTIDDIRAVARPVLRHRLVINYHAQADGETSDTIVKRLLEDVPVRKGAADAAVAKYSDPEVFARIADLTLRSRRLVEGTISGMHRSPFHGFNVEFAEYREYTPGDDLRRLDWRVFGRTDRHYIKQYEEESNLRVTFVMDASASMRYKGSRRQCRSSTTARRWSSRWPRCWPGSRIRSAWCCSTRRPTILPPARPRRRSR